jgi:hypothetical protein
MKARTTEVPEPLDEGVLTIFVDGSMRESPRRGECDQTFGMDFENYIVGPLYEGRGNYQMDHPGFVAGLAEVRGRIRELGWREALVSEIDGQIRDEQWRRHETPDRIERYGKKYGWIAYYELAVASMIAASSAISRGVQIEESGPISTRASLRHPRHSKCQFRHGPAVLRTRTRAGCVKAKSTYLTNS